MFTIPVNWQMISSSAPRLISSRANWVTHTTCCQKVTNFNVTLSGHLICSSRAVKMYLRCHSRGVTIWTPISYTVTFRQTARHDSDTGDKEAIPLNRNTDFKVLEHCWKHFWIMQVHNNKI